MAFSYSLRVITELTPVQALQLIADECFLERHDENRIVGMGVSITAKTPDDFDQSLVETDFGFRPTLHVGCRTHGWDWEDADKKAYQLIGRAITLLLSKTEGGAVLLSNGENVLLQRMNGKLMLNEGWDEWIRPQLDAARLTYEVRRLRSPALEEQTPTTA